MFASEYTSTNSLHKQLWLGLMVSVTIALSFAFACAAPFAALAAIAALMLPSVSVVVFMVIAWAINQLIGFAFLQYPIDSQTLIWAPVMGLAAISAAVAACAAVHFARARVTEFVVMVLALASASVGFQAVLLLANLIILGNLDAFDLNSKISIALIDMTAFGLLWLATKLAVVSGFFAVKRLA